jgi:hypothetical protein
LGKRRSLEGLSVVFTSGGTASLVIRCVQSHSSFIGREEFVVFIMSEHVEPRRRLSAWLWRAGRGKGRHFVDSNCGYLK